MSTSSYIFLICNHFVANNLMPSRICFNIKYYSYLFTGPDYIVNTQNPQSSIFTVTFQHKQAKSSEHAIQIVDDSILEGREYFRLRINDVHIHGQLATVFVAQEGVLKTSVQVNIEDNDSKSN